MDLPNNIVCLERYRRRRLGSAVHKRRHGGSPKMSSYANAYFGDDAFADDHAYREVLVHLSKEQARRRHLTLAALGVAILLVSVLVYAFCHSFAVSMSALI